MLDTSEVIPQLDVWIHSDGQIVKGEGARESHNEPDGIWAFFQIYLLSDYFLL